MNDSKRIIFSLSGLLVAATVGCVSSNDRHDEILPIAQAGDDRMTDAGANVVFDGTGSRDPLGGELTYKWTLIQKPDGVMTTELVRYTEPRPSLYVQKPGIYVVDLTVTADGTRVSKSDYVSVYVSEKAGSSNNKAPKAKMGLLLPTYCPGEEIALDGASSFDADSDELTYNWSIYGSSAVAVLDSNLVATTVLAPDYQYSDIPDSVALNSYNVNLVVGDGLAFNRAEANFTVAEAVARISGPAVVEAGESFVLEGGNSCVDGASDVTYEWFEASNSTQKSLQFIPQGSTLTVRAPEKSGVTINYVLKINGDAATATFPVTTK